MSSIKFNGPLDMSHHGPPHPSKDAGVVADSLTGTHSAMVKCQQELHTQGVLVVTYNSNHSSAGRCKLQPRHLLRQLCHTRIQTAISAASLFFSNILVHIF
jgi:hypothetical protein